MQASMKRFYETKKFSKTLKQWYLKLAKTGFQDAEYLDDNLQATRYLRTVGNTLGRSSCEPTVRQDVLEYYQICTHWQHQMQFVGLERFTDKKVTMDILKKIWELHCDGCNYAEIYSGVNSKKKIVGLKKIKKLIKSLEVECFKWHKYSELMEFF